MLSRKTEVHNISQRRQRRRLSYAHKQQASKSWWILDVSFWRYARERTNTHTRTTTLIVMRCTPTYTAKWKCQIEDLLRTVVSTDVMLCLSTEIKSSALIIEEITFSAIESSTYGITGCLVQQILQAFASLTSHLMTIIFYCTINWISRKL